MSDQLSALEECMVRDRHRIRMRLRNLERLERDGVEAEDARKRIERDLEASKARVRERRSSIPSWTYDEQLPIAARRDVILEAIRDHQVVVVCGETGSGKTTQLPKLCLELGRGVLGSIGHTQPRRIAARSVAKRIAEELQTPVGEFVGWKVRFDDRTKKSTCVKLLTDGMLLAETQRDRLLEQYDTLIVDEAHERSLNIDFLLGYIKGLLPLRPDLKVIITSATIDPHRFSEHFDGAPIVEVSGRTYPVSIRYRPAELNDEGEEPSVEKQIAAAVEELDEAGTGDVLVFLTGEREIRECAEALEQRGFKNTRVLPLFARLSSKEQQRIFQSHKDRHIVLSTNVAETSLTVPGIRYVIDAGRAKVSRYNARAKIQRLPVERISQASARQRSGRCGRLEDGICIRLYDEEDFERRREFTQPEIQRTNLASVILQMKSLHLGDIEAFPFIDPPSHQLIRDGYQTLFDLGAVDESLELTELGWKLAHLPIDPRVGRILLEADELGCVREMITVAAALSVQDPQERPSDRKQDADKVHARLRHPDSDVLSYLVLWNKFSEEVSSRSRSGLRTWCKKNYLSYPRMREWDDLRRQISELADQMEWTLNEGEAPSDDIHRALISGFVRHVAIRTKGHAYVGTRNAQVYVFPGSTLFVTKPKWIVSAERVETTRLYARIVAPIERGWIEPYAAHLVKRTYSDAHWDPGQGHVLAFERVALDGLVLVKRRRVHFGSINPKRAREIFIRHALVHGRYQSNAPSFRHNRELQEEAKELATRARDRVIALDADDLYAFFDGVVAAEVVGQKSFERWRQNAEQEHPTRLFLQREEFLTSGSIDTSPSSLRQMYPDSLDLAEHRFMLRYRFEPGHRADGITLRVPLPQLDALSGQALSWLVPGWLPMKITALLKTLPKSIRRTLVPLPTAAAQMAETLRPAGAHLLTALSKEASARSRQRVSISDFSPEALEPHLEMNIQVLGNDGRIVAEARSLDAVKRKLTSQSKNALAKKGPLTDSAKIHTAWNFESLPEEQPIDRGGYTLPAYPALLDMGRGVRVTLVDGPDRAARVHTKGLNRLALLILRKEGASSLKRHARLSAMKLKHATLGSGDQLEEGILGQAIRIACTLDNTIRTKERFEQAIRRGTRRLAQVLHDTVLPTVERALSSYDVVTRKLMLDAPRGFEVPIRDMMSQLARLVEQDWIAATPIEVLERYPRYLNAMDARLVKLGAGDLKRDQRLLEQVRPHWDRYLAREGRHVREHSFDPELETYRWMIEEFRVSLFSKDQNGSHGVTAARLRTQWQKCSP